MTEQCMHDGKAGPCERPAVEGGHFCGRHLPKKKATKVVHYVTSRDVATECPLCRAKAVVPLTPPQKAAQPDDTTHVCHPGLDGCNHGFHDSRPGAARWVEVGGRWVVAGAS